MKDKNIRNLKLAAHICEKQLIDEKYKDIVVKIIEYMKADLATSMVFEFPELQGYVGKQLALYWGIDNKIAEGISEHYLPMFNGDKLPSTLSSSIASVVDKIDVICAHFVLGNIPTGSNDPYALRRQTNGILNILLTNENLHMDISLLIQEALLNLESKDKGIQNQIEEFFLQRLENILKDRGIDSCIVKAVLSNDIALVNKRLGLFTKLKIEENFAKIVEAVVRVNNISKNSKSEFIVTENLFELPIEHLMLENYKKLQAFINDVWGENLITQIKSITKTIEDYFTQVMVMVEDERIRNNRLAFLGMLDKQFKILGNFKQIVI